MNPRRRTVILQMLGLPLVGWARPSLSQATPLQVGVLPNVSARVLLTNHQPMRQFLERELKRNVEISTAPNFKVFHQRTIAGDYDIVITAPHMARLAQVDGGYVPMTTYQPGIGGLLVRSKTSSLKEVTELRGAVLAVANPQSLVVMKGMQWLRERGLQSGTDFSVIRAQNEDSLARSLLSKESALAMMSTVELRQVPEATRNQLEVLTQFTELPGFISLAGKHWEGKQVQALKELLVRFASTPEGAQFFDLTGLKGLREVSTNELQALDPFVPETRNLLTGG